MSVPRAIEFSVSFILAFLFIAGASFLSLRPVLMECRAEVRSDWEDFLREVSERNQLLPGLTEAIRGFEAGHGKLIADIMEGRTVSARSSDPDKIIGAVDKIERGLGQVEKLLSARPEMKNYPPFASHWDGVARATYKIDLLRRAYNKSARLYNRLLTPFPQNLLVTLFGFFPLSEYPPIGNPGGSHSRK